MKTIAEQLSDMSAVKIAFAAEQMRAKRFVLDAEPLAIVGLSCRFPGANSPDAYWQLLEEGRNAIREVPLDRWPLGSPQDIDSGASPDEAYRYGGFIDSIGDFDPTHFGISPREAECMDPQQRLLMEVTWEALENACLAPEQLFGSRTSVYIGISTSDYRSIAPHGRTVDRYFSSGTTFSVAAGRLSYALGLKGPTLAIDTACSSSLVAIHLACQSLRCRESDVALAGGVNALLSPETSAEFSKLGVLAPDGRCKAFDASADGYVRGEGCGVVVLKRLASALQSGDRIIAVIRGSALNHDGRSGGLTVPNGPSQEEVIRSAVTQAGLRPEDVKYLEAHGTGTSLGDPIEMAAAAAALAEGRTAKNPLLVGSVKTNIGHLEAASGIAGLIKVAMAIQHGAIPRQLHLKTPNPHIAWGKLPVAIVTETMGWPAGRRIAGVSSFGMSGTNAHVILEEPPPATEPEAIQRSERTQHVLPLSAKNEVALQALAARYTSWWAEHPEAQLGDVAFTMATGRSHLKQRAAVVAGSPEEARTRLAALQSGDTSPGLFTGEVRGRTKLAWLFTGQGSQYVGMGRDLYAQQPVFRRVIDDCAKLLGDALAAPLQDILFEKEELLGDTRYAQPAIFALELALARLWQSFGIEPDVVLGHSLGEYVAACVAGVFDWEAGLHLVAQRALWMSQVEDAGAMAAVFADAEQVADAIRRHPELSVAAYNGAHVVVSGAQAAVEQLLATLRQREIRCGRLNTSHAFHSSLIEPALEPLEALAGTMAFRPARRTLISNLTGRPLASGQVLDAAYWRRHAREPVQFARSLQSLADQGVETLLEIGPQPVLIGMAATAWPQEVSPPAMAATLRRGSNDNAQLAETLGQLYVRGVTADFAAVHAQRPGRKLSLPTYPFQRQRYWMEHSQSSAPSMTASAHPLLGVKQELASGQIAHTKMLSWKQDALRVIEALEARIDSLERAKAEPIAVIGLACRVPGASDSDAFWRLLDQGVDAIGDIPADRFDVDDYYDPDPDAPGKTITRRGGFLSQIDRFDAELFGISPREAVGMDPQQRLLLEVSWEALEQAALSADRLRGSRTGVFMGISSFDYAQLMAKRDEATIDAYLGTGVAHSASVGRISYLLGLEGPNLAIDTACSSSLVAVHQARRSLLAGESDLALAGGVNTILTPAAMISFSRARMLAADGHCKTFDAAADGFSRAEGCGVVVLKRLSDAKRDGDRIMAVIRGSAVNQDGASSGLTVPNGPAQTRVIREALAQAGIAPGDVDYLEAHGTGTSLGDPIEVEAAAAALGEGRDPRHPLLIGSVKTNIGHLEAAAGIAGLIKVVLSLQHERIPPHLHFRKPNPHIPWAELPVRVTQEATAWPKPQRIAGVSAFGFSGTNAHVVLQSAPDQEDAAPENETPTPEQHVLPLSAKNEVALQALAARYTSWWAEHPQAQLGDVAFTMATGRSHLKQRAAVVADSPEEARTRLAALQSGDTSPGLFTGEVRGRTKLAWLFTGQGSQYVGMGRDLYAQQPVFRRVIDDCAKLLGDALAAPLQDILFEKEELLGDTRYAQPAIFALELALARLWQSFGIEPDVVLGHSLGEYVAACVAGVFDWEAGLHLVAQRALWMSQVEDAGAMAAVFADAEQVADAIRRHPELSVAAYNGAHVVVSGAQAAVEQLLATLRQREIRCGRLNTSHAFHSSLIEPALEPLEALAGTMAFRPARRTLISNLTGRPLASGQVLDAAYWRRHAREPVQFARSLQSLADQGVETLLEIGPQPVLIGMAATAWPQEVSPPAMAATLRRGSNDNAQLAETLGQLYVRGVTADFAAVHAQRPGRKLSLPTYPFQRQRYWMEHSQSSAPSMTASAHPLLGVKQELASGQIAHTKMLSCELQPWLLDHRVFGEVLAPGALYLSMALCLTETPVTLSEVSIREALWLREADSKPARQLQLMLEPAPAGEPRTFAVFSRAEAGQQIWTRHAEGKLESGQAGSVQMPKDASPALLRDRLEPLSTKVFYEQVADAGIQLGDHFRGLKALWTRRGEALGEIALNAGVVEDVPLDPAVLDACLQVSGAAAHGTQSESDSVFVPFALERLVVLRPAPAHLFCHARMRPATGEASATVTFDLWVYDQAGAVVARIEGLVAKRATRQALFADRQLDFSDWLYTVRWRQQPRLAGMLPADFLPSPSVLGADATGSAAASDEQTGEEENSDALNQLDQVARHYILRALQKLGAPLDVGQTLDADALVDRLRILPRHRRLLVRMLQVLAEHGVLRPDGARWQVVQAAGPADLGALRAQLDQEHPQSTAERALLDRCGGELAEVLTGRTDPLGLLFPQQGIGAQDLYRDSSGALLFNGLIARLVKRAVAELPADRRLRVLEIGAGTGGTTGFVLPVLPPERTDYVYTDLSAGFFAAAETRFAAYPFVRYQTLDIERDPGEQGFAPHQFDLVLAANVLHATRDLEETLRHVRQLLAPGGLLLLLEGLRPLAWVDLTFGLLEGWWRFNDAVRSDYPLMNKEKWRHLLQSQMFTEPTAIVPPGSDAEAVLLARGPSQVQSEGLKTANAGSWLILADEKGVGQQLAARLRQRRQHCLLVHQGKYTGQSGERHCSIGVGDDAQKWELLMKEQLADAPPLRGVVHLWSVDAADTLDTTAQSLVADIELGCRSVLHLMQALVHDTQSIAGLWLVTSGGQTTGEEDGGSVAQSGLWGMGKVLALEHPELACRRVDLDPAAPEDCVDLLVDELLEPDPEDQIALRPSGRWVPRLLRGSAIDDRLRWPGAGTHRLVRGSDRTLAGLHLEALDIGAPEPGQVQVRVHAAGLNFRDVLDALGMVPVEIGALGSELSGEVLAVGEGVDRFAVGDRVVGLSSGTFANRLNVPEGLLAKLPPGIGLVQGATIPVAFVTAELALRKLNLQAGQRILIHAASGGVGLAAVQVAQAAGAEIFATASRPKQAYLRSIGVKHVFDSRSTDFAEGILEATDGKGIDAVLNSLTGKGFIEATLDALSSDGRFVELSKRDVWPAWRMQAERPDVDYHVLGLEAGEMLESTGEALGQLMERFANGELQPLPLRVWPLCEAPAAFRWMQQARHIGKNVLRMPPLVEGRFSSHGTYLITGGLGGLGLEVARWMVHRGVRHLVLNGRRPPDEKAETVLAQLRETGAEVRVELGDIAREDQVRRIVDQIDVSSNPLRGVIHSAGVLRDGALMNQDWSRFAEVLAPKTLGAWHLHRLTADRDLDLFVLFSSGVVLFGNRGQANHAAANTFLNALAHHRQAAGLPAASIDWGAWSDIGAAARRDLTERLSQGGFGWITPEQGIAALERAIGEDHPQLGVIPVDWKVFARQPAAESADRFLEAFRANQQPDTARSSTGNDLWNRLRQLPAEEHLLALTGFVQDEVARVLRLRAPPDVQAGFTDLGMDSLMAVELRNRLQSELGQRVRLSSTLAFDYPTTAAMAEHLLKMLEADPQAPQTQAPRTGTVEVQRSDRLDPIDSEAELDVLLSEKVSQVLGTRA